MPFTSFPGFLGKKFLGEKGFWEKNPKRKRLLKKVSRRKRLLEEKGF
jgi:hypothetical protein